MRTGLTTDLDPEQRLSQLAKRRHISAREVVLESLDESLQRDLADAAAAMRSPYSQSQPGALGRVPG